MKKIYEQDPYLMPFKGAIDARHERISEFIMSIIVSFFVAASLTSCVREKDADAEGVPVHIVNKSMTIRRSIDEQESNKLFYSLHSSPLAILLNSTRIVEGRPKLVLGLDIAMSLGISEDQYKEYITYLETVGQ